jgi:hypothetical protein
MPMKDLMMESCDNTFDVGDIEEQQKKPPR